MPVKDLTAAIGPAPGSAGKQRRVFMLELDCLGDMCPVPIMKLKQCGSLKQKGEQVKLITDHSCVLESVAHYCKGKGLFMSVTEPMNGIWEITVEKK